MSKEINKDIEVGDYIRTKSGKIRKVKTTVAQYYITDRLNISDNNQFTKEDIVKHSKNIIDLIEIGDLVFIEDFFNYRFIHIYDERMLEALKEVVKKDVKIKQILTHEQYMQNCYTVEREE